MGSAANARQMQQEESFLPGKRTAEALLKQRGQLAKSPHFNVWNCLWVYGPPHTTKMIVSAFGCFSCADPDRSKRGPLRSLCQNKTLPDGKWVTKTANWNSRRQKLTFLKRDIQLAEIRWKFLKGRKKNTTNLNGRDIITTLLEKPIEIVVHKPCKLPLKAKLINSISCLKSNCAFRSFIHSGTTWHSRSSAAHCWMRHSVSNTPCKLRTPLLLDVKAVQHNSAGGIPLPVCPSSCWL